MKPVDILKSPLLALQIFSGFKSFEKNALLSNRWLNERGLHLLRVRLAGHLATYRRRKLAPMVLPEHVQSYERDGFVRIEDFLDSEEFAQVKEEIAQGGFDRFDMHQGAAITRRSMIDDENLESRPALKRARDHTYLHKLVQYVASHAGRPLVTLQTVFAEGASTEQNNSDPQTQVHSDTFHATAKAWLFLVDVGEEDGPFCYVAGSHKMTERRYAWEKSISTSLADVDNRYSRRGSLRVPEAGLPTLDYPAPTKLVVKANTLVVADTHGFHARCPSFKPTTRIELYASLRRNPFNPFVLSAFGGLHLAALPMIRGRTNRLIIDGLARLNSWGIRGNPWRDAGKGYPDKR